MTATQDVPAVGEIINKIGGIDQPSLTPFEGKPVYGVALAIRNTGDGLSAAMEVDPVELHIGDVIDVVLRCEVDKVRYDEVKDTDGLKRVQMLKAIRATPIQSEAIDAAFVEQQKRLEELQGVQQLDLEGGEGEDDDVPADPEADDLANLAEDPSAAAAS